MRLFDTWTAFLLMLFALVGLCGLFTSFAAGIPLQRGVARSELLDQAASSAGTPDAAQRLEGLRPMLGDLAPLVIDGTGTLGNRIAEARRIVANEQQRESASVDYRVRLMLGVVTVLSGALGAGILALVRRNLPPTA